MIGTERYIRTHETNKFLPTHIYICTLTSKNIKMCLDKLFFQPLNTELYRQIALDIDLILIDDSSHMNK